MKSLVVALLLTTIVHALPPRAPPGKPANIIAVDPPQTAPPHPTPKEIGELPKDGLKGLPYPNFDDLANILGFDPAKAIPNGKG
jgi:hypothetical protein